jgi:multicomponent Na+:H+ antiporter subunit D
MNAHHVIPLLIALPLAAGFLIPLIGLVSERAAKYPALLTGVALVAMAWSRIGCEPFVYALGGWEPPFGIALVSDGLSGLFHLIIATAGLLVIVYSVSYMRRYTSESKYYALLMIMIAGMNGVVASGDLFNMYVFLEISAIASYALVAFGTGSEELEASMKYIVLGGVASSFILFGIALMYSITGTLNLADIARTLDGPVSGGMVRFIAALFIMGFGLKAALIPFHAWLPDAHPSAPAPISAMLSGLLIKVLGAYCLMRLIFTVFGFGRTFSTGMVTLGIISMVGGALLAVGQWDFKRLLAYSSISQMGYIIFALGLGTPLGLLGGLLHLLNHTFFKSLLFLCSGAVEYATGTRDLKKLGGLWNRMPVTATTCSIASLSISAVPPFGGFFSKFIIVLAAVEAVNSIGTVAYALAGITVFVSFITLVYFVKVQKMVLFGALPNGLKAVREVPLTMRAALVGFALCCLGFGLFCPWLIDHLIVPARAVLIERSAYILLVLGSF